MKKILSAAASLLVAATAFAQVNIGAGYLNQTDRLTIGSGDPSNTSMNGFYVGAGYDIGLGVKGLALVPGVYYSYNTTKKAGNFYDISGDITLKEHYITVPVRVKYAFEVSPSARIFLYGGPAFSAGISSKYDTNLTLTTFGLSASDSSDNYGDNSTYGRFDVKLGAGAGIDISNMVRFTAGYDWGLLNRYTGDSDVKRHTNVFHVGVAYLF